MSRRLNLLYLNASLATVLLSVIAWPSPGVPDFAASSGGSVLVTGSIPNVPQVSLEEARKLFGAPVARKVPEKDDKPTELALVGAVIGMGDRVAIVSDGKVETRLRVGQNIRGWTVQAIERDKVVLREGAQLRILELRRPWNDEDLSTTAPKKDPRLKNSSAGARKVPQERRH